MILVIYHFNRKHSVRCFWIWQNMAPTCHKFGNHFLRSRQCLLTRTNRYDGRYQSCSCKKISTLKHHPFLYSIAVPQGSEISVKSFQVTRRPFRALRFKGSQRVWITTPSPHPTPPPTSLYLPKNNQHRNYRSTAAESIPCYQQPPLPKFDDIFV